jgi:hypothetical protein
MTTQETAMSETMGAPENPAAFPMTGEGFSSPQYSQYGMTLRDYFAGQALAGGTSGMTGLADFTPGEIAEEARLMAMACYMLADALLAARSTK